MDRHSDHLCPENLTSAGEPLNTYPDPLLLPRHRRHNINLNQKSALEFVHRND